MTMHIRAAAALAALGLGAVFIGSGFSATTAVAADKPFACSIKGTPSGQMLKIEGILTSAAAASGTYQLEIESSGPSGDSDISQGSAFAVRAGETATIGQAMVSGTATTKITLSVKAAGNTTNCTQTFGAAS